MKEKHIEATVPSRKDLFGAFAYPAHYYFKSKPEHTKYTYTDFAVFLNNGTYHYIENPNNPTNPYYIMGSYILADDKEIKDGYAYHFDSYFNEAWRTDVSSVGGICPMLKNASYMDGIGLDKKLAESLVNNMADTYVSFGEYPQTIVSATESSRLEKLYVTGNMYYTGKKYHIFRTYNTYRECVELYDGHNKFVRIVCDQNNNDALLSNKKPILKGDYYWFKVEPITWCYDHKKASFIATKCLLNGIPYDCGERKNDKTLHRYLNEWFLTDIRPSALINMQRYTPHGQTQSIVEEELVDQIADQLLNDKTDEAAIAERKENNPYNFTYKNVSEEDIIKGAIESGIAVFLHGRSSEGKSDRVKQIDPDCIRIYLKNATPESLNGKSALDSTTGKLYDIKPTWLVKLEEKCAAEPDKKHIVFFDEITNALPSLQGAAFNIVLDREVNGKWNLPENARVVAAGNEMEDSLAANQIAEPLFNRFAHVYINTTVDKWLKWASENDIHPAIYSYIAYLGEQVLRTEYNGHTPNADPRKWEMASDMLKETNNPQMLRSLIGEDLTREFIEFCKQEVITLEDVIKGNYNDSDIYDLDTAERYATVMALSQVDINNLLNVRKFVQLLGEEFTALFDTLWAHNDEQRLFEIMALKNEEKRM